MNSDLSQWIVILGIISINLIYLIRKAIIAYRIRKTLKFELEKTPDSVLDNILHETSDKLHNGSHKITDRTSQDEQSNADQLAKSGETNTVVSYEHIVSECLEPVEFAVFAPENPKHFRTFTIDVWAYFGNEEKKVLEKLARIYKPRIVGQKSSVALKRGSELVVSLSIEGLEILSPTDIIYWTGVPANAQFRACRPKVDGIFTGVAEVRCEGMLVTSILFELEIEAGTTLSNSIQQRHFRPKQAFASYSSKDRIAVAARVQGMKKISPHLDIFMDCLSLRSGEDWKSRIDQRIEDSEVLYLFWSRDASKSKFVEYEWRSALKDKGLSSIDPVPLESPAIAVPPMELSSLHFDDIYLSIAERQRYLDSIQKDLSPLDIPAFLRKQSD